MCEKTDNLYCPEYCCLREMLELPFESDMCFPDAKVAVIVLEVLEHRTIAF